MRAVAKSNAAKAAVAAMLLGFCAATVAQAVPVKPYSTVCLAEKSTGFNWEAGDWAHARFKADTRLHIQLIEPALHEDAKQTPYACIHEDAMRVREYQGLMGEKSQHRAACYIVKKFGEKSTPLYDAEICYESYKSGRLERVDCSNITFSPDGGFIQFPRKNSPAITTVDPSLHPAGSKKDSLYINVGKCSRLEP